ncbi:MULTISPECIES: multicopper oxidase domain-containing protein [unclassified Bradyrhizobium]|uniref:multicopper oxidase family protein n=1 Tax=unclassified Bradyrhizobium TaxID=2631580 RepID=UPI0024784075|nr:MULTISPECIES: multicopper oxidase domain-containing protein [unclassified Bradyrhizobium]WGR74762.1 multicopper oxidase domain-containing protein [Bradyrhizobium sp. ISRA426]WGR79597.1 multicopper oxidase domain-containing protein [Bradyrhizobium sp. ISRA430]WGR89934.1 multicopper oxidase domain-containing protein [Bradyrhizobium sp. ISRA432]
MTTTFFAPTRRDVLAGLGASAAGLIAGGATSAATARLALQARPATLALRSAQPATPIWELAALNPGGDVRLKRGERCEVTLRNDLPVPVAPAWYGLDGASAAEPLLAGSTVTSGGTETSILSMPHAGILMADLRLLDDGLNQPVRPLPIIVQESEPSEVDRDEPFLVEDWRLAPDGTALLPGAAGGEIAPVFTVNGKIAPDFTLRANERLRLRMINGCQRAVIAVKFEGADVLVMALDGQPAEPFTARNGALVLAPGGRADVFLDGTTAPGSTAPILLHDGKEARPIARLLMSAEPPLRPSRLSPPAPLPSNGLPANLDLGGALRFDVALGLTGWVRPSSFSASAAPAFRAKAGRTVVLALKNIAAIATVFHLHGHHFRLLDRLDDGWKPYWLDTLAIEPGQTQRIAFATSTPGRWLIESVATDWAAPRLVRWYAVE